jgi:hypothetical protein
MDLRRIDALVAEHVMGWVNITPFGDDIWGNPTDGRTFMGQGQVGGPIPRYSTDIAAAWEVVEKLGIQFYLHCDLRRGSAGDWMVFDSAASVDCCEPLATAETAPLAICLAALKLKGVSWE